MDATSGRRLTCFICPASLTLDQYRNHLVGHHGIKKAVDQIIQLTLETKAKEEGAKCEPSKSENNDQTTDGPVIHPKEDKSQMNQMPYTEIGERISCSAEAVEGTVSDSVKLKVEAEAIDQAKQGVTNPSSSDSNASLLESNDSSNESNDSSNESNDSSLKSNDSSNESSDSSRDENAFKPPWYCGMIHECGICNDQFYEKAELLHHIGRAHDNQIGANRRLIIGNATFECLQCSRKMTHSPNRIKKHLRSHNMTLDCYFSKFWSEIENINFQLIVSDPKLRSYSIRPSDQIRASRSGSENTLSDFLTPESIFNSERCIKLTIKREADDTFTAPPSLSQDGTSNAPPLLSQGGTSNAPPSLSQVGTSNAPPSLSQDVTSNAPPLLSQDGRNAPPSLSQDGNSNELPSLSQDGTSNAPPLISQDGTFTAPPSLSQVGTSNALPSLSQDGNSNAQPSLSQEGTLTAPPSLSQDGTSNALPLLSQDGNSNAQPSLSQDGTLTASPSLSQDGNSNALPSLSQDGTSNAPPLISQDGTLTAPPSLSQVGTSNALPSLSQDGNSNAQPSLSQDDTLTSLSQDGNSNALSLPSQEDVMLSNMRDWLNRCNFSCAICHELDTTDYATMSSHMIDVHHMSSKDYRSNYHLLESEKVEHVCQICGQIFRWDEYSIRAHLSSKHRSLSIINYYSAFNICYKDNPEIPEDPSEDWMNQMSFNCKVCHPEVEFKTQNRLVLHLKVEHSITKRDYKNTFGNLYSKLINYSCLLCHRQTRWEKDSIKAHLEKCHSLSPEQFLDMVEVVPQPKNDVSMSAQDETLPKQDETLSEINQTLSEFIEEMVNESNKTLPGNIDETQDEIEDAVSEIEEPVSEIEDAVPEIKDAVPKIEGAESESDDTISEFDETLSEIIEPEDNKIEKVGPEIDEALPQIEETLSEREESLPEIDEVTMSNVDDELPDIDDKLPDIDHELSDIDQELPDIDEELPDIDQTLPIYNVRKKPKIEPSKSGARLSDMGTASPVQWNDRCTFGCEICRHVFPSRSHRQRHLSSAHQMSDGFYNSHFGAQPLEKVTHGCLVCHEVILFDSFNLKVHANRCSHAKYKEHYDEVRKTIQSDHANWMTRCIYYCRTCKISIRGRNRFATHLRSAHDFPDPTNGNADPMIGNPNFEGVFQRSILEELYHTCQFNQFGKVCGQIIVWDEETLRRHLEGEHHFSPEAYFSRYMQNYSDTLRENFKTKTWKNQCSFLCRLCNEEFEILSDLQKHMTSDHFVTVPKWLSIEVLKTKLTKLNLHSCQICFDNVIWEEGLIDNHFKKHHLISVERYAALYLPNYKSTDFCYIEMKKFDTWMNRCVYKCFLCRPTTFKGSKNSLVFHLFCHHKNDKLGYFRRFGSQVFEHQELFECHLCDAKLTWDSQTITHHLRNVHDTTPNIYRAKYMFATLFGAKPEPKQQVLKMEEESDMEMKPFSIVLNKCDEGISNLTPFERSYGSQRRRKRPLED